VAFIDTPSLFASKKLAIILRPFESKSEKLKKVFENEKLLSDSDRILLIWSDTDKIPRHYDFLLQKPCQAEEFPLLRGAHIRSWIAVRAQQQNVTLEPALIAELMRAYGSDLWA